MAELSGALIAPNSQHKSTSAEFRLNTPGTRDTNDMTAVTYYLEQIGVCYYNKSGGAIGTVSDAPALVWAGSPGASVSPFMDHTLYNWVIFFIPGGTQLYAARESQYAQAIADANGLSLDVVGVIYSTPSTYQRYQAFGIQNSTPVTPIVVVTSDSGGSSFVRMFGSNPFTIHGHWSAGTKVLDTLQKTFAGSEFGSTSDIPSHGATASAGWTVTGDWLTQDFLADLAANGNTWRSAADNGDGPGFYDIWPSLPLGDTIWHTPAFGLTIPGASFDPTAIWDEATPRGLPYILSNTIGNAGGPTPAPGTASDFATDVMLIRGIISLPPLPPDPMTGIGLVIWNGTEGWVTLDQLELNNPLWTNPRNSVRPGGPGAQPKGRYPGTGYWDWIVTAGLWIWGGDNNLNMSVQGAYTTPASSWPAKDFGAACYIDVAFDFDNGTSYRLPPTSWETGSGGEYVVDSLVPAPSWFGHGVVDAVDLGNVGVDGRAYFFTSFAVPSGTIHGATLSISAETGIGEIYINGTLVVSHSETIDLWSTQTTLVYTLAAGDFVAGATNNMAVQCYSSSGPCQLIFQLQIY